MEWLSHSHKKHCELCKTPFRFTKLYDSHMPQTLPLPIFVKRAFLHTINHMLTWVRAITVALVWLVILPWCVRWSWRGMFWILDAGWARDPWLAKMAYTALQPTSEDPAGSPSATPQLVDLGLTRFLFGALLYPWKPPGQQAIYPSSNSTHGLSFVPPYSSLLSDVKAVNSLTSNIWLNRFILDMLEGEIITVLVVIVFILVFLIREWVVQQQPIINAAAQIRDAELQLDVAERENQHLQQLHHDARVRLDELDREAEDLGRQQDELTERLNRARQPRARIFEQTSDHDEFPEAHDGHFIGWHAIEDLMVNAGRPHQFEGEDHAEYMQAFEEAGQELVEQLKLAEHSGIPIVEIADNTWTILESLDPTETDLWRNIMLQDPPTRYMLVNNLSESRVALSDDDYGPTSVAPATHSDVDETGLQDAEDGDISSSEESTRRPIMPPRDASSHAQRVLQSIEESSDNTEASANNMLDGIVDGDSSRGSWQSIASSVNPETASSSRTPEPLGPEGVDKEDESTDLPLDPRPDRLADDSDTSGVSSEHAAEGPNQEQLPLQQARETPTVNHHVGEQGKSPLARLFDWFWADIELDEEDDGAFPGIFDEDVFADEGEELQFIDEDHAHDNEQDPEVLEAAAEDGLDARAIEDAEDLEGVLELIGMQGPLVGLLQTAMFCGVLITTTLWGAIGMPYLFGKIALLILGDPIASMIMTPLRFVSFVSDVVVDATIYVGGAATYFGSQLATQLLSFVLGPLLPKSGLGFFAPFAKRAHHAANGAGARLAGFFSGEGPSEIGLLTASIQARQSLHFMKAEAAQVIHFVVSFVCGTAYHLRHPSISNMTHLLNDTATTAIHRVATSLAWGRTIIKDGLSEAVNNGSLTYTVKQDGSPLDPSLAIWTTGDRCLTIFAGHAFIVMISAMYLLRQDSIFDTPGLQRLEKTVTDLLKQAGGVLKVILIISIEMLAFPLYCGLLLDCALLPLFENASIATRLAFAERSPWLFTFLHWFIGTCYMFHFALFVSTCRRIMRKGVLYFIRDPDDPTFHPVRDVLERSVTTQLRKIAFSGLVYGGLVIVCLGGAVWGTSQTFGVFPIRWARPEADLEFPIDFLGYNLLAPVVARYLFPSSGMEKVFGKWLRMCARSLRLSQFLFGSRRKVEEGHLVGESWISKLNPWKNELAVINSDQFVNDGKYVRAPGTDQVRIPRGERVFLEVDENDVRLDSTNDNNGVHGRQPENFTQVYIPPWFRVRLFSFISLLWMFAIAMVFGVTVIPMVCGRQIITMFSPGHIVSNDLYAFAVGITTLGVVLQVLINGQVAFEKMKQRTSKQHVAAVKQIIKKQAWRLIRSAYVYGFAVIVVPSLFALVLQLYLILPMHTYMGPAAIARDNAGVTLTHDNLANTTLTAQAQVQAGEAVVASHTFHILQDWTLGFIYGRVVLRLLFLSRNSRPAAAVRMITRDGLSNPNARLATRAFVLPTLLLFSIVLFWPALVASVLDKTLLTSLTSDSLRTKVYRYSYPICASQVVGMWCTWELAKGLKRWRGRIKDEVYLIGERLHNFGERRPPEGSKSVVRSNI
jgi:E3 ubiquitin-protein ligase MARCH6